MPELPDITVYVERSQERLQGQVMRCVQVLNPFVLRTALPPIAQAEGREVVAVQRLGQRVVLALQGDWTLIIHLLLADRALSTQLKKSWQKTVDYL